jgi:hypothetical protein
MNDEKTMTNTEEPPQIRHSAFGIWHTLPNRPALLALACLFAALVGCNDQSQQIASLQKQLTETKVQLDRETAKRTQSLATTQRQEEQIATLSKIAPGHLGLVPRANSFEIAGATGLRRGKPELSNSPTTRPVGAGSANVNQFLRLYLVVRDQDSFPMRAVGPMTVSVFDLSGKDPRALGAYSFSAQQVAKLYRSALASEIFAFDLPLFAPPARNVVTVHVEFTDWLTGRSFTAERSVTGLK